MQFQFGNVPTDANNCFELFEIYLAQLCMKTYGIYYICGFPMELCAKAHKRRISMLCWDGSGTLARLV